jgi:uncharacterized protein YjiS (DUF1127 family)
VEQVISYQVGQPGYAKPFEQARSWLMLLANWYARYQQRQALQQLDDHLLADIGVSRSEALAEARKPFWLA